MKRNYLKFAMLLSITALFFSCDDDGIEKGDPNYWTTSRGQFTTTTDEGKILYFLDNKNGTATVTFDGRYPLHQMDPTSATVYVNTYAGDVVIPEKANNLVVKEIGNEAFLGCHDLVSLSLPETITEIGEGAFTDCKSMEQVNIPNKVREIPDACFGRCIKLTGIDLPDGITRIGRAAFYNCSDLSTVTLPDGLEEISSIAFFFCPKLVEITIPASIKRIGDMAFGGEGETYCNVKDYYMLSSTPPILEGVLFKNNAANVNPIIHVPAGSLEVYKAADGWKELQIIEY